MFKKLLLVTCVAVIVLWAAGYDIASVKSGIMGAADNSAGTMSGRDTLDDGGWAD